jgi:hypothetical protein
MAPSPPRPIMARTGATTKDTTMTTIEVVEESRWRRLGVAKE